jgi:ATP-dependent DNA helicase Rep
VLRAANALIANNPHEHLKKLWSDQADGERIRVWECRNSEHEAEKVAAEIAFVAQSRNVPWSDFCILFRGNFQSRPLEKAMQLLRIPYHLTGGTMFLERQEVKDTLAWLRLLVNPDDDTAFMRAVQSPKRDVGAGTLAKLAELAQEKDMPMAQAAEAIGALQQLPPRAANSLARFTDILRDLRAQMRQVSRRHDPQGGQGSGLLSELRQQAKEKPATSAAPTTSRNWRSGSRAARAAPRRRPGRQLALLSRSDKDEGGNQVRMMTMHASKGLEFRTCSSSAARTACCRTRSAWTRATCRKSGACCTWASPAPRSSCG